MNILGVPVILVAFTFGAKTGANDVLGYIGCFNDLMNIFGEISFPISQNSPIQ